MGERAKAGASRVYRRPRPSASLPALPGLPARVVTGAEAHPVRAHAGTPPAVPALVAPVDGGIFVADEAATGVHVQLELVAAAAPVVAESVIRLVDLQPAPELPHVN